MLRLLKTGVSATEEYFHYIPIDGLAYMAVSVFVILGGLLAWVSSKNKPCKFMITLVVTCYCEGLGYALRVVSAHNTSLLTFIFPYMFILLSPNAMALVNYIVVGRALNISNLNVACLRPKWIAGTFLFSDVVSFSLQAYGGGMLTSTDPAAVSLGEKVLLVGLCVQCATLFLFLFVTLNVHLRPRYLMSDKPDGSKLMWALYTTTCLLFVRSTYRAIEFGAATKDYVQSHEWFAYAFDFAPISLAFLIYTVPALHFGRCLNALQSQCAQQQETDAKQQGDIPGSKVTELSYDLEEQGSINKEEVPSAIIYVSPAQVCPMTDSIAVNQQQQHGALSPPVVTVGRAWC